MALPLLLGLALLSAASDDDEAAREAELFGAPATSTTADDTRAREDAMFGEPAAAEPASPEAAAEVGPEGLTEPDSSGRLFDRLRESDDVLDIGGRAFLRLDLAVAEDVPFGDQRLSSPSFLDVYLDVRPNDLVRGFVRGRLNYDLTIAAGAPNPFDPEDTLDPVSVALDQLWLKFAIDRTVFLTVGKQSVRFGVGRIWNPTDFLNRERLNPLEVFDQRLGVGLVKVHVPIESLGWNFYAIASWEGRSALDQVGAAGRAEFVVGGAELSLSIFGGKDQPLVFAADVSAGVWLFDLKAEVAVVHGSKAPFWTGALILPADREPVFPEAVDREDDWIPFAVLAAELTVNLTDEDALTVGLEYLYNHGGYEDERLYPWLLGRQVQFGETMPFLYLGQHYLSAYALLVGPGSWNDTTLSATAIANLSDQSAVMRFDLRQLVLTYLRLNAYVTSHVGTRGGEFRLGFRVPPVAGIPALANGFELNAPLTEVGVGATLDF